jgi:predicted glycosyltransferase
MKKRVLLFCHDGTSLGHLRRISRVATSLQCNFVTLVLTGMREASWIVDPECEFVKIPSWDGIVSVRALRLGRRRWAELDKSQALKLRSDFIRSVGELFDPDLIIVDYLPFGQNRELEALLFSSRAMKYFLHRGISDTSDAKYLHGNAIKKIAETYDRIIIASDRRLGEVEREDEFGELAIQKVTYVGLVGLQNEHIEGPPTVVCSGGSGRGAESLVRACFAAAHKLDHIPFRIVLGPRADFSYADLVPTSPNCKVVLQSADLPAWHFDSAVTVSGGGYNSVVEAACGGARVIVHPVRMGDDDEQLRFAQRMGRHYPVRLVQDLSELQDCIRTEWNEFVCRGRTTLSLDATGATHLLALAQSDLGT